MVFLGEWNGHIYPGNIETPQELVGALGDRAKQIGSMLHDDYRLVAKQVPGKLRDVENERGVNTVHMEQMLDDLVAAMKGEKRSRCL